MNILINYADSKYESARKWNSRTGRWFGRFDKVCEFKPVDIDSRFNDAHKDIFSYERGNGLWLWKPYFIEKVIRESKDGDNIFYLDSGAFFIRDPRILLDFVSDENPIFVCDQPLVESCWTKPELFDSLNAWDFKDCNQFWGGFHLIKVNEYTRKFYREWLRLCCVHDNISPAGLGKQDIINHDFGSTFVSHREDQSIFSLMCHKNGIKAHRDISQRGKHPDSFYNKFYSFRPLPHDEDKYPSVVYLHKSPSIERFVLSRIYTLLGISKIRTILANDFYSRFTNLFQ